MAIDHFAMNFLRRKSCVIRSPVVGYFSRLLLVGPIAGEGLIRYAAVISAPALFSTILHF
jgi:hypothetical protein